jgi:hypothetical protein
MAERKRVIIEWNDTPGVEFLTLVAIEDNWTEEEDDPDVFFYFDKPEEYEEAKKENNGFDFRIIRED